MKNKLSILKKQLIIQKATLGSLKSEEFKKENVDKFIEVMNDAFDKNIKLIDEIMKVKDDGK